MKDPLRPLADRIRPRNLAEFVGQSHLLGPGKPLAASIEAGQLHSLILWGPPGTGKTTLARLIAASANAQFIALSAVMAGVKDIRAAVERRVGQAVFAACDGDGIRLQTDLPFEETLYG